jgi:hypothetical protein
MTGAFCHIRQRVKRERLEGALEPDRIASADPERAGSESDE